MSTYSFLDVSAAIQGPGGNISMSQGGVAEEGITVAHSEDKNSMVIGADGVGMHSLHAGEGGTVTVRLLKTSPINSMLMDMYNYQRTSSAYWGQNVISVRNPTNGDDVTARQVAFRKAPDYVNAKNAGTVEWTFDAVQIDEILGDGGNVATL